jgi:hypothetical protein
MPKKGIKKTSKIYKKKESQKEIKEINKIQKLKNPSEAKKTFTAIN